MITDVHSEIFGVIIVQVRKYLQTMRFRTHKESAIFDVAQPDERMHNVELKIYGQTRTHVHER